MTNEERKGKSRGSVVGGGGEGISTYILYIHKEVLNYKMRALMAGNV